MMILIQQKIKYPQYNQNYKRTPMTFHVNFPRYQVETAYDQFQSPTQQKAEEIYQKYVNQKVPCELFLDGKLQKEYKPLL